MKALYLNVPSRMPWVLHKRLSREIYDAPDWILKRVFAGFYVKPIDTLKNSIVFSFPRIAPFSSINKTLEASDDIPVDEIKVDLCPVWEMYRGDIAHPWETLALQAALNLNAYLTDTPWARRLFYRRGSGKISIETFEMKEMEQTGDSLHQQTRVEAHCSIYQEVTVLANVGFIFPEIEYRLVKTEDPRDWRYYPEFGHDKIAQIHGYETAKGETCA